MKPNAHLIMEELATNIQRAINTLLSTHQVEPKDDNLLTVHTFIISDYKIKFLYKDFYL